MGRWIPPIPKGALYRRSAVQLGQALPLLYWCYDYVERDGWVPLNLADVSDALDVPYPTVKRWWQSLHASGILAEVTMCGRGGLRARFADDWLDWSLPPALLNGTKTGSEMIPNTTDSPQGESETGSEMIPNTQTTQATEEKTGSEMIPNSTTPPENGIRNGTKTGSESIPQNLHIGTHVFQAPPPPPVLAALIAVRGVGGGGGDTNKTEQNRTPGRNTSTETERWLAAEGMGTAQKWGHLPLDAVQADVARRKGLGQGWGAISRAWDLAPPGSAPPPQVPKRQESESERLARLRREYDSDRHLPNSYSGTK